MSGHMNKSKVCQNNLESLLDHLTNLGISQILLFGVPKKRNETGDSSFAKHGVIQNSIRKIRENFGYSFRIFSDVCLCQYNTSGHCGILTKKVNKYAFKRNLYRNAEIDNDRTLESLGRISLSLCDSGTDFIAPSAMMDGQVLYLRKLLNTNGFEHVKILSYSAKHNSCLYSPFRANNYLESGFIDKSSYQCSFYNKRESLREMLIDIKEGSDWVMIKPSLWYMDIIRQARELVNVPIVVQNVSGEYALLRSTMNPDSVSGPRVDDNRIGENKLNLVNGVFGLNQRKIESISRERSQLKKPNNLKKPMMDNDFLDASARRSINAKSSPTASGENRFYNPDPILNFIRLLKRAGADKIITYFLLDMLDENSMGKRTI